MTSKICAWCGERISDFCPNQTCKDRWQKQWEQIVNDKIGDHQREIDWLQKTEVNILTLEDYQKLRKIRNEAKSWEREKALKTSPVKLEVEKLLQDITEAEKKFPERIKLKAKGKSKNCRHENISWSDFFKSFKEKQKEPYCSDCGEDENPEFTEKFQRWYCKEIEKWLANKALSKFDFANFFKKKNYYDNWCDLRRGKFFENIKDELVTFQEMSSYIEEYCLEFAKEKGINIDNNNSPIEREQLQSQITNLTNKPAKSKAEEEELAQLKEQLVRLEQKKPQQSNNNTFNPLFIITTLLLVVSLIIVMISKKKHSKPK